jgi:DNA-binding transcriptional LysR family regulator
LSGGASRRDSERDARARYPRAEDVASLRIRELELLLAIDARKSVTAAAQELGLTQPAASRTLRDIEQMLRVHLFERDRTHGMQVTGAGRLVIARARSVLADIAAMRDDLAAWKEGSGGQLRLGLIPFVPGALIERLISRLIGDAHRMSVSIVEGSTSQLLAELSMQRLDAVIGRSASDPLPDGLARETLLRQDACLLAHPRNATLRKSGPTLADLAGSTWLLPPKGTPTRAAINDCFVAAGLDPPVAAVEAWSTKIIHWLVGAHPEMLSIVPSEVGRDVERLGGVRRHAFPVPLRMPPVGLFYATRHRDAPGVRNLRSAVREVLRDGWAQPGERVRTPARSPRRKRARAA